MARILSLSKDSLSKDGLSKDGLSKDGLSKDGLSKDGLSKDNLPLLIEKMPKREEKGILEGIDDVERM